MDSEKKAPGSEGGRTNVERINEVLGPRGRGMEPGARPAVEFPYLVRRWMGTVFQIVPFAVDRKGEPDLAAIQRMVDETGFRHCLALAADRGLYFEPGAEAKLSNTTPSGGIWITPARD
jgi:hypothetical protein